jgi:phosphonopyruvate decarboxylase|tara:strand:- start:765 stop:1331 length:567 start_codon:yes stop_codon:yes gene_type:complete
MFKAFESHREDSVVIVTGTGGKHWADHTTKQNRDLNMGGAMGHTTSAALGLALGLPDEKVVLFDSEGALLMNLGIIATIAGQKPKNFLHLLMDNECYATTGGQPVPNSQDINYAGMAKEAGYTAAYSFDNIEDFTTNIGNIMKEEGPVFVAMKMVPEVENEPIGNRPRRVTRSRAETITALRSELGIS